MVVFEPIRAARVSGGRKEGMNSGNVATESGTAGGGDHGRGGHTGRELECWRCGKEHMKRDCTKRAEEKEKKRKDGEGLENKRVEVTGGQLHAMFTSSVDVLSGTNFSNLRGDNKFMWHQFRVKGWGA